MPDEPSAIFAASRDTTRHPRNADGKYTLDPPPEAAEAVEAGARAIGRTMVGQCFTPDAILAGAAYAAMEPLIRRQVAEEIARAVEARKPSVARFWDTADAAHVYAYNAAAAIAREIGERHA